MIRMLNAGFGEPLGHELPALKDLGVEGIRTDCQRLDAATTAARVQEIVDAGLVPLAIVRNVEQLVLLPPGTDVELRNEPDLEGPSPTIYAGLVQAFVPECERLELHLWAGAVSNLHDRGFKYLKDAQLPRWPESVHVSVHWYPHKDDPKTPHPGFKSREHEVETLKALIGDRRWAVSEFGYRTSLPTAAASVAFEFHFWQRMGADFACLFQLNDGTGKGEHFGIRSLTGEWKPVASTFRT